MSFEDYLDQADTFTSNAARVLRGVIDAAEQGFDYALVNLRPLAAQLDEAFGDSDDPLPSVPDGGVPVDAPVAPTDADAAASVGVTTPDTAAAVDPTSTAATGDAAASTDTSSSDATQ